MSNLYKRYFDCISELEAFVHFLKIVHGLELKWNLLEKSVFIWCNEETHNFLNSIYLCNCDNEKQGAHCSCAHGFCKHELGCSEET